MSFMLKPAAPPKTTNFLHAARKASSITHRHGCESYRNRTLISVICITSGARRKGEIRTSAPVSVPSTPSTVRAPEPWHLSPKSTDGPGSRPAPAKSAPPRESLSAAASKRRRTWRELSLSGPEPLRHARIAITPAIAHPAHGAAIVEVVGDENGRLQSERSMSVMAIFRQPSTGGLLQPVCYSAFFRMRPPVLWIMPARAFMTAG